MKRLLRLVSFMPFLAFADDLRVFTANPILTAAAPTAATAGFNLSNVAFMRVSACAESGQTLAGAGSIHAYTLDHSTGLVNRNPALDLPVSVTATSCSGAACRCQVFPDMEVGMNYGDTYFPTPNGVTVSGGTTVTTRVEGVVRKNQLR